MGMTNLLLPSA